MKATGRELYEYDREQSGEFENDDIGYRPVFIELGELCLEAGPKGLRKIAKFLNQCAKHMEEGGGQDHFHFNSNINDRPQIVILNKKAMKALRREREIAESQ